MQAKADISETMQVNWCSLLSWPTSEKKKWKKNSHPFIYTCHTLNMNMNNLCVCVLVYCISIEYIQHCVYTENENDCRTNSSYLGIIVSIKYIISILFIFVHFLILTAYFSSICIVCLRVHRVQCDDRVPLHIHHAHTRAHTHTHHCIK